MSKLIKSQKMIKEGLWTIELMDGTIIQCTNNDDFKLKYNQNNDEKTNHNHNNNANSG
jgi:DNA polymerase elongation subunit (family B)